MLNKTILAAALMLTVGAPALAKTDAKTEKKPTETNLSIVKARAKTSAEKKQLVEHITSECNQVINSEHGIHMKAALNRAQKVYDLVLENFGKESPEMVWPEFAIGHTLGDNRDSKNAIPHFEHAYTLATKYPDNPCMRAKEIEIWLFKAYLRGGKSKRAIELVAPTLDELEKTKNLEKLQDYALLFMKAGECEQADAVVRRAVACSADQNRKLLKVLQTQIMILLRCRRFKDAIPIVEKKMELLRAKDDQTAYADSVREVAQLSDLAERYEKSSRYYKEAIKLFREQKRDKYMIAKLLKDYSRVQRNLGRTSEADALKKEYEDLILGIK